MTNQEPVNPPLRSKIISQYTPDLWALLEVPSQPCSIPINSTDADQIRLMEDILNELDDEAAGLAAIQIGYPRQIFILRRNNVNKVYINPTILFQSKETKKRQEACLSIPGFSVRIDRPKIIKLQYFNIDGLLETEEFSGIWSQAVAHEMDHLNGKLIITDLQKVINKQIKQTSFGMKLTPHKLKILSQKKAKRKKAKLSRKANR